MKDFSALGKRPLSITLFALLMLSTLTLKFSSDHLQTLEQQNDHLIRSDSTTHFAASSMMVNYSQEIQKLSDKFKPASDINDRVSKVQKQYLGHQIQVKILGNFTFSQLNTQGVNCKSTDTVQALSFRTTQMKQYLINALNVNQVNFINDLKLRQTTRQSIENQILYLNGLQKFLQSGCTKPVKITETFFVSNPNANNWILGEWNYDQFISSYVSTVNSQTKVTKCPMQLPYFDQKSGSCINCAYPNNVWDMKGSKCTACPYTQVVNLKMRRCVSQIKYLNNIMDQNAAWITNKKDLSKVYEQFNKQKSLENTVVCPFDTPFILGQKCSICPQKLVYSLESTRCVPIPYNMQYDKNLHKVVQKLQNYQTNELISGNLIQGPQSCPAMYPYYDSITCINCEFPNYFNQRRNKCEPCLNLESCGQKKQGFVTNSLGSKVTARTTKQVKDYFSQNAQKIKDDSVQQCPINTPYYDLSERKCIKCAEDKYLFDIKTFSCVSCPSGSNFNQVSYLCEEPKGVKTNAKANFLIVSDIKKYQQQQSKIAGLQCPSKSPYFNGKQCITCQEGYFFDTGLKNCTQCPTNTTYDSVLYKCDAIKYKTNSLADRLLVPNLAEYQTAYKNNTGKQCPTTEPFFNGTSCISCTKDQIFNTSSQKCTVCPQGTNFISLTKNCGSQKPQYFVPGKSDNLVGSASYSADKYLQQMSNISKDSYNVSKCKDDQNSKKTGCIKCSNTTSYFDVKTLQCTSCKNYSKQLKICYDNMTYVTNVEKKDKFLGLKEGDVDKFVTEQQTKSKSNPDTILVCSLQKPFLIKGVCQNCDKYFNVVSSECTTCDSYDVKTKKCLPNLPKVHISNLKYGVPAYYAQNMTKILEDYDKGIKNGTPICQFSTPFFNDKQCIACPTSTQYFNLDAKKCQNCTSGNQFNTIISQCQQEPPKFYTALQSLKLIFDGQPISYYQYKVDQAKKAGSTVCASDKPYQTKNNKCESCPQPTSYFNLLKRVCTKCPEKTSYIAEDHQCQSEIGDIVTPSATLQKSLANLFT